MHVAAAMARVVYAGKALSRGTPAVPNMLLRKLHHPQLQASRGLADWWTCCDALVRCLACVYKGMGAGAARMLDGRSIYFGISNIPLSPPESHCGLAQDIRCLSLHHEFRVRSGTSGCNTSYCISHGVTTRNGSTLCFTSPDFILALWQVVVHHRSFILGAGRIPTTALDETQQYLPLLSPKLLPTDFLLDTGKRECQPRLASTSERRTVSMPCRLCSSSLELA